MKPRPRKSESGYALLFILAMAAIVAITLYKAIPRVAFEAQRDREQLLIDRGEQYTRAVTLYVRKFNKFPADFDALQSTQNLRFLRHKYIDPMTGKDDWRIIHVGPGGIFTDSLIYNKKKDDKQTAEQQTFITEMQQTGGNQVDPNQNVNVGTRQRPTDQPGAPGDPSNPAQPPQLDANGQPVANGPPPVQVLPNGQIVPVQQGNQTAPGQPFPGGAQPGQPFPGGQTFPSGQQLPGQQFPGQQLPGGVPAQQPYQTGGPPTAAGNLINQILTTPRPGGLNGLGGAQQGAVDPNAAAQGTTASTGAALTQTPTAGQTVVGGGIAGVASKLEEDGIKIYKEQKSYHKWEFVYDISKDPARGGGAALPQAATPQQNANMTPGAQTATTPTTPTTPTNPAPATPPQ
jgi:type II secretory pathway pseudopilin PulG